MDFADLSPTLWRKSARSSGDGACVEVALVISAGWEPLS
ncbi:DUF397 domain-containing protein [Actinoallomurus rhizosphaericola]